MWDLKGNLSQLTTLLPFFVRKVSTEGFMMSERPKFDSKVHMFIEIIILGTRYEFNDKNEPWDPKARSAFLNAPEFGSETDVSSKTITDLWSYMK